MKNKELEKSIPQILGKKNVIVEKSKISGNAINVYVNEPEFEDMGSFTYYTREADRDADFNELTKKLVEKNGKN